MNLRTSPPYACFCWKIQWRLISFNRGDDFSNGNTKEHRKLKSFTSSSSSRRGRAQVNLDRTYYLLTIEQNAIFRLVHCDTRYISSEQGQIRIQNVYVFNAPIDLLKHKVGVYFVQIQSLVTDCLLMKLFGLRNISIAL